MNYHSDRFKDHSFIIAKNAIPIGIIPGESTDKTWSSHRGLTFGGINSNYLDSNEVSMVIDKLEEQLKRDSLGTIRISMPPSIYSSITDDIFNYTFWKKEYKIESIDLMQVIRSKDQIVMKKRNGMRKALNSGLYLSKSNDCKEIYRNIQSNLKSKYGIEPTHTYSELMHLKNLFPGQIQFVNVLLNEKSLGGAVIFEYDQVHHLQYLALDSDGKYLRAQDLIIITEIESALKMSRAFSFGKSTSGPNSEINTNLLDFKLAYGAKNAAQYNFIKHIS